MSDDDVTQPIPVNPEPVDDRRVVTVRTAVVITIVASLLSVGAAVGISYAVIGKPSPGPTGPAGPVGAQGEPGSEGPAGDDGDATVNEDDVWNVIEGDPQRAAAAVNDNLDPLPSDVQGNIDQVSEDLSSLCSTLSLADALSNEYLSCP